MKNSILTLLLILAISPFLVQCASQDEVTQLNYQLRVVNKKLEDMKNGTMGQMQKRQAASSSQMDQLQKEILILKGQLEETAHLNRTLKEQNKELDTSIKMYSDKAAVEKDEILKQFQEKDTYKNQQIAELTRKLEIQQESVKAIQSLRVKEAERRAREAARKAEAAKRKTRAASLSLNRGGSSSIPVITATHKKIIKSSTSTSSKTSSASKPVNSRNTVSQPKTSKPAKPSTSSNNLFSKGQNQYKNGNYKSAYKSFEQFIEKTRSGEQNIEARYMMGECLFWQKEYDQAILQYQKIISNHPRHTKAASALLRQGMAFEKLSDQETAKIIYKKITSSYGSSPEAITAKQRSANL